MDGQDKIEPFGLKSATLRFLTAMSCAGMFAAVLFSLLGVEALPEMHGTAAGDFDIFYTVAQLALQGRLEEAYDVNSLLVAQAGLGQQVHTMTWTYPPPFNLLLMPLGLMSKTAAYLVFTLTSLCLLLLALRFLSGQYFGPVLIASLPAILVSLRTGQNGTLTAALITLGCVFLLRDRKILAGVTFGFLVIKPHLAVGVGLWCLVRWCPAIIVSASVTILALSALSAAAFGFEIWSVFLSSATEAGDRLGGAEYPAFRMSSLFAALVSLGATPDTALAAHAIAAILAVAGVLFAAKALDTRVGLAGAIVLTPLYSPYIYDYDLALFAPALALLLPALDRAGRRKIVLPVVVLTWVAGGTGFLQNMRGAAVGTVDGITLAGFAVVILAGTVLLVGGADRA